MTARDTATNKSQSIRISGSTRLKQEDKERMVKEAEHHAEEDKKRREEADKLNSADSICYEAERMLGEFAEKLTADMKGKIETALREARAALAKRDVAAAADKADALRKLLKEAGVAIYAQQPGAGVYSQTPYAKPESGAGPGSGTDERVVDAQFRETG